MLIEPTHLQKGFIYSAVRETLFGGSRGGGKTFAVILDWLVHSEAYDRDARGIVFRRSLVELDDFIEVAKDVLGMAGHKWMEQKKQFVSPKGAILRCRYLESDADAGLYQGHAYTRVYIEEIGNFPNEAPIKKLLATLRSAKGVPCQFKATANPGGAGHSWVKARYIDPVAANTPFSADQGKTFRVYIPAKLTDNPHLMVNDPGYIDMLRQAGDAELVRAWLEGDWDVVVGQYFKEFSRARHVIPTIELPRSWSTRYRAMDWGSAKPYCVLWFAVATGDALVDPRTGKEYHIPRGALVVYRELYGWNGQANQGSRETSEQVAARILAVEADADIVGENQGLCKIDPATFATNGGPSIAETMARNGVWWNRADNRRVQGAGPAGGWDQVRSRLRGEEYEVADDGALIYTTPMVYFMDCCVHIIRTLPTLPSDPNKPDDVDTHAEDHPADTLRYGCMARPYTPPPPPIARYFQNAHTRTIHEITMEEAWACAITNNSHVISRA